MYSLYTHCSAAAVINEINNANQANFTNSDFSPIYFHGLQPSVKVRSIKQWKFWKKVCEMDDTEPLAYVVSSARRYNIKEVKYYILLPIPMERQS